MSRTLTTEVSHRAGYRRCDSPSGVVTCIQRFGSALNLNVHLHMLVPDGVRRFVHGRARFARPPVPTDGDIERSLALLIRRITRCLERAAGLLMEPEQP